MGRAAAASMSSSVFSRERPSPLPPRPPDWRRGGASSVAEDAMAVPSMEPRLPRVEPRAPSIEPRVPSKASEASSRVAKGVAAAGARRPGDSAPAAAGAALRAKR